MPRQHLAPQRTFTITFDFIRAVVFTVVEVVAAKDGTDATPIGALELILLAYWCGWRHFWRNEDSESDSSAVSARSFQQLTLRSKSVKLTAVDLVAVVPTVVDTIAVFRHWQAHAIIMTAKLPCGWTLEFD